MGKKIPFEEVYAVLNPLLIANFANWRLIMNNRMQDNPGLFIRQDWKSHRNLELRSFVYETYLEKIYACPWNDEEDIVPIIPCIHGCDFDVAKSIASKGFASLASLDAGFYGKGVYFTTFALYSVPYFVAKMEPAIIISLACPANVYPVVEHHEHEKHSLLGKPHVSGFQTHYVLTQKNEHVIDNMESPVIYDEIVISQEAQVVPIFIGYVIFLKNSYLFLQF